MEPPPETADRRTAAEKKFDEQAERRELDRIAKMTAKSHRQRIAEFNEHLGSLTEHMVCTLPPPPSAYSQALWFSCTGRKLQGIANSPLQQLDCKSHAKQSRLLSLDPCLCRTFQRLALAERFSSLPKLVHCSAAAQIAREHAHNI